MRRLALIGAYIVSANQLCESSCPVLVDGDKLLTGGAMRMCQVVITEAFCLTADISKTWRKKWRKLKQGLEDKTATEQG